MRLPRRWGLFLLALVLPCSWISWRLASRPPGPPRCVVDRDAHNWGRVKPGSGVTTSFEVVNRGGKPLLLGKAETSCGCTKPTIEAASLPPGGRTKVRVGFQVSATPGLVGHFIRIPTNDPDRSTLILNLFADSWVGVRAVPQAIDTGPLKPGSELARTVQLFSPDSKPFRLGHVSVDREEIRAVAESPDADLPVHRVRVSYRAGPRLGAVRGSVRVVTNRVDAFWVDIPVGGEVVGPITVHPSFLQIERDEIGEVVKRTVILKTDVPGRSPEVESVKVTPPWELVDTRSHPSGRGRALLDVMLRFPEGSSASTGELRLSFREPEVATYCIPVSARGWSPPLPAASD